MIELVYKDLNKAFKLKDNFINRGMKDLSGVIYDNLSIESRFQTKKAINLTDSGTEILGDPDEEPKQRSITIPSSVLS